MNNTVGLVAVSVALLALASVVAFKPTHTVVVKSDGTVVNTENLGATPGGESYTEAYFLGGLYDGGITATSTTNATVPLKLADFDTEAVVAVTLNQQDATLSFPASSTMAGFLPQAGMSKTFTILNATNTASMDITLSGGTGVLMKKATSTAVINGDTDRGNHAVVKLTRLPNTNFALSIVAIQND